jgi:hypothetical protein
LYTDHGGEFGKFPARYIVATIGFEGETQKATTKVIARRLAELGLWRQ